jgi:chemotaxis protein methyltransferase CheR
MDRLLGLIEEASGIVVPPRDRTRVATLARARAKAVGCRDLEGYVRYLQLGAALEEWRTLLGRLTVKESYLFRAARQFTALEQVVLPDLVARRAPGVELRIWSAGCARGEEAATLAVVLSESRHLAGRDWRILASDVDERALDEAKAGVYGVRAVARVPPELLERYFEGRGDGRWRLDERLLARIEFRPVNLVREPLELPRVPWDIVFLRNVLIYFSEESQARVVRAVAAAMPPDGWMFLGPSESLLRLETDLDAVDLDGCFAYRVRKAGAGRGRFPTGAVPAPRPPLPAAGSSPRAPRRVRSPEKAETPEPAPQETIVAALADGQIDAALVVAETAVARVSDDALLRALLGLCRDRGGDAEGAIQAYRAALYLDPGLFQVRSLLAACFERLGWPDRARREQREVLTALRSSTLREVPEAARLGLPSAEEAAEHARTALG